MKGFSNGLDIEVEKNSPDLSNPFENLDSLLKTKGDES